MGGGVLALLLVAGLTALGIWIGHTTPFSDWRTLRGWAFATFLFGLLVGPSEILSRYRDEPLLAATASFCLAYLE
jgi:hypothetical protein